MLWYRWSSVSCIVSQISESSAIYCMISCMSCSSGYHFRLFSFLGLPQSSFKLPPLLQRGRMLFLCFVGQYRCRLSFCRWRILRLVGGAAVGRELLAAKKIRARSSRGLSPVDASAIYLTLQFPIRNERTHTKRHTNGFEQWMQRERTLFMKQLRRSSWHGVVVPWWLLLRDKHHVRLKCNRYR